MTLICHVNLHPLEVQVNQDGKHVSQEGTSVVCMHPHPQLLWPFPWVEWGHCMVGFCGILDKGYIASLSLQGPHPGQATTHAVVQGTSSWRCLDGLCAVHPQLCCTVWGERPLCFPLTGSHLQHSTRVSGDEMDACHWCLVSWKANHVGQTSLPWTR